MNHPLGQLCALLTAVSWAYALVLFKLSGERIPPIALNLFKNAVGLVLLLVTLAVMMACGSDSFARLREHAGSEICLLLLSGVIGIAIADTLLFYALNLIGVGLLAVVDCTYAPTIILFAWLLIAEKLLLAHYIGAALIVAGVFIVTRHQLPAGRTRGQMLLGMFLAQLSIALMAVAIVITKPIIESVPLVWSTTLRLTGGFVFLALFALLGQQWRQNWAAFRPRRAWKYALPGSILGTYICLIMWIGGFKYTYASVAAALNQTSVIFAGLFAALILKEQFGRRKIAALVLGMIGVLIVTIGEEGWQALHTWVTAGQHVAEGP